MITLRRVDDDDIAARASGLRDERLTYPEVLATQGAMPAGYRHDQYARVLGRGDDVWEKAKVDVMAWKAHSHAGVRVLPDGPPTQGEDVMLSFTIGPAHVLAPCRIVHVVDEQNRVGFVYGTLPGHPERGEESFMVERLDDRSVRFVITAFSRPDDFLVRLGGPIARRVQARVTHKYLEGLASV